MGGNQQRLVCRSVGRMIHGRFYNLHSSKEGGEREREEKEREREGERVIIRGGGEKWRTGRERKKRF